MIDIIKAFLFAFWENFMIAIVGVIDTIGEMNILERLGNWWNKRPQIEEVMAMEAIKKAGDSKKGKSCVITGSNSGIGFEAAKELAKVGYNVVMAVRSKERGEAAKSQILKENPSAQIDVMELDVSDLDSVHAFVEAIKKKSLKIDLLVNNAGVMFVDFGRTKQGFETHLASNHLGHYVLANELLPLMESKSRVLVVVSNTYRSAAPNLRDLNFNKDVYNRRFAYSNSKLLNVHFATELARLLKAANKNIGVFAINPGTSSTNVTQNMNFIMQWGHHTVVAPMFKSAFQAACNIIYAGLTSDLDDLSRSGTVLYDCRHQPFLSKRSQDASEARKVWELTQEMTKTKFPF